MEIIAMKKPPKDVISHSPGSKRGEEWTFKGEREAGREGQMRTARDATSISSERRQPIDPRMPYLPPA
jgi:hypothetical protein